MQFSKKTITTNTLILLLLFATAATLITIPTTTAHTPAWTISTYAFIIVSPNPVGVGQTAYVNFFLDKVPPTSIGNWGMMWHNMKLNVTDPDGVTTDLGTFSSDAAGGAWTQYIPNKVGVYTFGFSFPGQVTKYENPYPYTLPAANLVTFDYVNDTYTGSSAKTTLTVQEEPIGTTTSTAPLPTEYWGRPISSLNRNWYTISGNWYGLGAGTFGSCGIYNANNGNFNPYTEAPNSAHVLWTKPLAFGGQIGGEFGPDETGLYATGTAYENKFGSVIINGMLYYTSYPGAMTNLGPLTGVDLRTGETVWTANASNPLKCGMVYNFKTGNQYGGHAYLFTGYTSMGFVTNSNPNKWSMWDAMTGQWILDIANVTPGTLTTGPNGELLSYRVFNNQLQMWNISKCISAAGDKFWAQLTNYSPWEVWRPTGGQTIDWTLGNQWTVPLATNISGTMFAPYSLGLTKVSRADGVALLTIMDTSVPGRSQLGWRVDAGYSTDNGRLLWGPVNRTLTPWTAVSMGPAAEGVYTEYTNQPMTWAGYDITTGQKLWGPSQPYNSSWGYYDIPSGKGVIGYGNLYSWSMNGEVHAYNLRTGAVNWSWSTGNAGIDTPYGTWPLGTWPMQHILADGKIYVCSGHDYTPPVYRGAKLYCINATNGELIWDTLNFNVIASPAIAEGIMLWYNGYDDQVYAYGQGATKLTVTAPSVGVTTATPITITGTITDISAGTKQDLVTNNFPNGLPCVSDASMSKFMEAVYQQQTMPTDVNGVPITINVVDSNGNYRAIGTAVSNIYGTYSLTWTPDISGDYTVIASFAGTASYYPTEVASAFHASEPAATPAPAATASPNAADLYLLPGIIGIIIAIVVVGVVIILVLGKKP
jgi:hypothetical protein